MQRGLVDGCASVQCVAVAAQLMSSHEASPFVRKVLALRGRMLGPFEYVAMAEAFKDDLEVAHILSPLSGSLDVCAGVNEPFPAAVACQGARGSASQDFGSKWKPLFPTLLVGKQAAKASARR